MTAGSRTVAICWLMSGGACLEFVFEIHRSLRSKPPKMRKTGLLPRIIWYANGLQQRSVLPRHPLSPVLRHVYRCSADLRSRGVASTTFEVASADPVQTRPGERRKASTCCARAGVCRSRRSTRSREEIAPSCSAGLRVKRAVFGRFSTSSRTLFWPRGGDEHRAGSCASRGTSVGARDRPRDRRLDRALRAGARCSSSTRTRRRARAAGLLRGDEPYDEVQAFFHGRSGRCRSLHDFTRSWCGSERSSAGAPALRRLSSRARVRATRRAWRGPGCRNGSGGRAGRRPRGAPG